MGMRRDALRTAIIILALAASGCAQDDPVFGRSYDACILKNAKGGDGDSRANATDICARHFKRAPTEAEAEAVRERSTVSLKVDQPPTWPLPTTGPAYDEIAANVTNPSDDLVITQVTVTARFYKDAAQTQLEPNMPIVWNLDVRLEPGESGTVSGSFGEGDADRAPSRYFSAYVKPERVIPHSERHVGL